MEDTLLAFKVWGDFAHFRKIYSTTSPLTYLMPPKTALAGLVAAIIGLEKDTYHSIFTTEKSGFGVRIIGGQKKKIVVPINLIDTKTNMYLWDCSKDTKRTQIPFEFIKNPCYQIYLNVRDEDIHQQLKKMLKEGKTHYTHA
ncbi:MAG TPA: type I-B CRISPR-associated protein Cas5 [bacterium]|nr:type I-B CRISPR-associated protein Cas5 [bacterium]